MAEHVPRVNVTFEDVPYKALEKWANREFRTVANLVAYITVGYMQGTPPDIPEDIRQMIHDSLNQAEDSEEARS